MTWMIIVQRYRIRSPSSRFRLRLRKAVTVVTSCQKLPQNHNESKQIELSYDDIHTQGASY